MNDVPDQTAKNREHLPGVDRWVSSEIHAKTELAKNPEEQKALYEQWATSYDDEMLAHQLASYKSVTEKAIPLLTQHTGASISVIDVGCGTGLLGQHFREVLLRTDDFRMNPEHLTLVGTDLSPEMLTKAAAKRCFDKLEPSNLKQPLPFPNESFDMVISSGVFLPGHCGPESIPNMLALLKIGGYAVFTVREAFYKEEGVPFRNAVTKSGCELLEAELMPYYGEIKANVLVVRKNHV